MSSLSIVHCFSMALEHVFSWLWAFLFPTWEPEPCWPTPLEEVMEYNRQWFRFLYSLMILGALLGLLVQCWQDARDTYVLRHNVRVDLDLDLDWGVVMRGGGRHRRLQLCRRRPVRPMRHVTPVRPTLRRFIR